MRRRPVSPQDLRGVFAVPPLARREGARASIDFSQNEHLVRHITGAGITRLIYGGNAFLYHLTMRDYTALLEWLAGLSDDLWTIPSAGPAYGRAMDQAPLLRKFGFPCAMLLPCSDPRDARGLEEGWRRFAGEAQTSLLLYLKDETNLGPDKNAGLDVVGRLVSEGLCAGIKYAVTRKDPRKDPYLRALLKRVEPSRVISGIGERPAVIHMRDWKLPGFTTGSGCIAPRLSKQLYDACAKKDYKKAERQREDFLRLEDFRDAWNPAKVLHAAVKLAALADTGPLLPYLSPLSRERLDELAPLARALVGMNSLAHVRSLGPASARTFREAKR